MLLHKWSGAYESMIYCMKKFGHPHLAIAFPVLSFFPCWEVCAGGIPLACLHGDSQLWGERRLAIACPSDKSCLSHHSPTSSGTFLFFPLWGLEVSLPPNNRITAHQLTIHSIW